MSRLRSFDPDAQLAPTPAGAARPPVPAEPVCTMPAEWRAGIEMLRDLRIPEGAGPARWTQIVEDAATFARRCHVMAAEAGWTTGNIFGFELDQPDNRIGLVLEIRGGRVIAMNPRYATIVTAGKPTWCYRRMPDDASPIWRLRR